MIIIVKIIISSIFIPDNNYNTILYAINFNKCVALIRITTARRGKSSGLS